jgi:hypothetical protein
LKMVKGMIKMKATLTYLLLLAASAVTMAQKAENDDMYFTAKDRAKLKPVASAVSKSAEQKAVKVVEVKDDALNPTDSYSARNVNPEYSTRSAKPGDAKGDYFVADYTPTGVNGNLNGDYSSSNSYSQYNSPYANPYAYNNPYSPYSSFSNMGYGYPMSSPYASRWSMMYGMNFGYSPWMNNSMMSFGYGNGYGMYDPFYNPYMYDPFYSSYSSMYCPYSFYGYNGGYGSNYTYPGTVIVDNNNSRNVSHGRRTDRSTSEDYQPSGSRQPSVTQARTARSTAGGRMASTDDTQPYYQRGWKNNTGTDGRTTTTRSAWSNTSTDSNTDGTRTNRNSSSSWNTWDNGSGNSGNSGSSWSSGSSSPSRSSYSGGTSGGGSSGGTRSSSGGGTRGRD